MPHMIGDNRANSDIRQEVMRRFTALDTARQTYASHWGDVQTYLVPDRGRGLGGTTNTGEANQNTGTSSTEDENGTNKQSKIYDSTATRAMNVLSAGLMSGLTSPSRPWFRLDATEPGLSESQDVKTWLHVAQERMLRVFAGTNLYHSLHSFYTELGAFGTAAMFVGESFDSIITTKTYTAGEYWLAADSDGKVDTFVRRWWYTSSQIVDEYGLANVSDAVKNDIKNNNPDQRRELIHIVEPNVEGRYDLSRMPHLKRFKWLSIHLEYGKDGKDGKDKGLLRIGGFNEFPFVVARWETVSESVYGTENPGRLMLPDIRQLQKETELKLRALDKVVEPPLVGNGLADDIEVNTFPGGVTNDTSPPGSGQGLRPLYEVRPDLGAIYADIQDLRAQIREGLFNDLFLMIAGTDDHRMTATEVLQRQEEKMMQLGPVLERLHNELLDPLIERTFNIMMRLELFPPVPPALDEQDLEVEYLSVLAQAQKRDAVTAIERFAGFVGGVASVDPQVLDVVNEDEMVREYADRTGAPPDLIHNKEHVAAARQQRAQQEQAQQQMLAAETVAKTAKTLSETEVTGGGNIIDAALGT